MNMLAQSFTVPGTAKRARSLVGKSRDDALKIIPLIFNLCSAAHMAAARLALGLPLSESEKRAVQAEIIREHLIHVMLHWPRLMASQPVRLPQAPAAFASALMRGDHSAVSAVLATLRLANLDDLTLAEWLEQDAPVCQLLRAMHRLPQVHAPLPPDDVPTWFARVQQHPILRNEHSVFCRAFGRLIEIATVCRHFDSPLYASVLIAAGQAETPAARGRLMHQARLEGERICAYAISTPTDKILQDNGYLQRAFEVIDAQSIVGDLLMSTLDPCLPFAMGERHHA